MYTIKLEDGRCVLISPCLCCQRTLAFPFPEKSGNEKIDEQVMKKWNEMRLKESLTFKCKHGKENQ